MKHVLKLGTQQLIMAHLDHLPVPPPCTLAQVLHWYWVVVHLQWRLTPAQILWTDMLPLFLTQLIAHIPTRKL